MTDTQDTLREELAKLAGVRRYLDGWITKAGRFGLEPPDLASLVSTLEQGLSKEQLGKYAFLIYRYDSESDPVSWISFQGQWNQRDRDGFWHDIGLLIKAPAETRAQALKEVLG